MCAQKQGSAGCVSFYEQENNTLLERFKLVAKENFFSKIGSLRKATMKLNRPSEKEQEQS